MEREKINAHLVAAILKILESQPGNNIVRLDPFSAEFADVHPSIISSRLQMIAQIHHVITIYDLAPYTPDGKPVPDDIRAHVIQVHSGFNRYAHKLLEGTSLVKPIDYNQEDAVEFCKVWLRGGNHGREAYRPAHLERFPMSSVKEADQIFTTANRELGRGRGRPKN